MSDVIAKWSNAYKEMQNALDKLKTAQAMLKEGENDPARKEAAEKELGNAVGILMAATGEFMKANDEKLRKKLGGTRRRHRRKHRKTLRMK
jgi:hypothetical protein